MRLTAPKMRRAAVLLASAATALLAASSASASGLELAPDSALAGEDAAQHARSWHSLHAERQHLEPSRTTRLRPVRVERRQQSASPSAFAPSNAEQAPIVSDADNGQYVQAAQLADAMPGVKGYANGNLANVAGQLLPQDGLQYPWNQNLGNVTPGAAVNGSETGGWAFLPEIPGFVLNETMPVYNAYKNESGIMPFYISVENPQTVKRFIVVLPGKPRDTWKYANYMLNARNIVVEQQFPPFNQWGLTGSNESVGIVAPAFLNMQDLAAGACKPQYLCFDGSMWQEGGDSHNPPMKHSTTSFNALDAIVDTLFDKSVYPSLNQVVIAGHSLGGQGVQRYAVLKKTKAYDPNVRFWIGNPGSWAWLSPNRPYMNANTSCAADYNSWPYGLQGNVSKVSKYARRDVEVNNGTDVINRYRSRTIAYALALFDVGAGDTHCEAQWEGSNHLDRGSNFVMSMGNDFPNWPPSQEAHFVANVTHQDYSMYTANSSLQVLFAEGLNTRNPDLVNVTNPGDKPKVVHQSNGTHAFATPIHELMAKSLLSGSVGLTAIAFFLLPLLFRSNYNAAWEKQNAYR